MRKKRVSKARGSRKRRGQPRSRKPKLPDLPTLLEVSQAHINRVLKACNGNRTHAAKVLDVARSTVIRKIEE